MVALRLPDDTIILHRSCLFVPGDSVHEPFKIINLGEVGPSLVDLGPEDGSMAWGGDVKPVEEGDVKPVEGEDVKSVGGEEEDLVEGEASSCLIYPATVDGDYMTDDESDVACDGEPNDERGQ